MGDAKPQAGSEPSLSRRLGAIARRYEFAAGNLGFLFGLAVMTWDFLLRPWGVHRSAVAFLRAPESMVWIFLIAAQFGFWFTAIPFQWRWRCAVKEKFHVYHTPEIKMRLVMAILMFAIPVVVLSWNLPASRLDFHRDKVLFVNLVAVVVALVVVQGIWFVRAAIGDTSWTGDAVQNPPRQKQRIENYLFLRERLQRFITFLGTMIGLATLAKGALRHAFLATGGPKGDFPPEFVLLHGAYFTGLLALVYVPTYTRLVAIGSDLLDSTFPISSPDLELKNLADWQSNRKGLEELLQLRANAIDNIRASVSILAPLASAAVSVLIGDKILLAP